MVHDRPASTGGNASFVPPRPTTTILFNGLNASIFVNADTVRSGGGEKALRSSRLPPPNHLLSKTLNERAH